MPKSKMFGLVSLIHIVCYYAVFRVCFIFCLIDTLIVQPLNMKNKKVIEIIQLKTVSGIQTYSQMKHKTYH